MKVFNLQCAQQHPFEGWFGSDGDYASQLERGLLSCPLCGDMQIQKMLSAPRLNLRGHRENKSEPANDNAVSAVAGKADVRAERTAEPGASLPGQLLTAIRQLVAETEDVGERFADHARAMHHGDMEPRGIRGRTTPEVARELLEEGIEVLPLPSLPALKETLQ
jgi:hypothetical protein